MRDSGKISMEAAKQHAESEFEKYRIVQDRLFESDFDKSIKTLPDGKKKSDRPALPENILRHRHNTGVSTGGANWNLQNYLFNYTVLGL